MQAIADQLSLRNIDSANDFSPAHGIDCSHGGGQDQFAIRCHAALSDSERSAQVASLDFLIYDSPPDFSAEDAKLASAAHSIPGRWKVDDAPESSFNGPNGAVTLKMRCHQTLGDSNGPALCMTEANPRVLIVANVAPAAPSTHEITTDAGDTNRAAVLAVMGAVHVAESR